VRVARDPQSAQPGAYTHGGYEDQGRHGRDGHHGEVARIELLADDLPRALEMRENIIEPIQRLGYRFVTLDLCGFRSPPRPAME